MGTEVKTLKTHWSQKHKDMEMPVRVLAPKNNSSPKELKISRAFSAVLSIPCLSLDIFQNRLMRDLFDLLGVQIPFSNTTLKKRLCELYAEVKGSLANRIHKSQVRPSITCDAWSDKAMRHSYLGMTIHFCDEEFQLSSGFLGLVELSGSHTGALIRSSVQSLLSRYDLDLKDVYCVVTDNGSNIVSAFKDCKQCEVFIRWYIFIVLSDLNVPSVQVLSDKENDEEATSECSTSSELDYADDDPTEEARLHNKIAAIEESLAGKEDMEPMFR